MNFLLVFTALVLGIPDSIQSGKPIQEAEWRVTTDPEKGIYDAVILEDLTEIRGQLIDRYRRIRVLSEDGKTAASLSDEDAQIINLTGRVVDINGNETRFNTQEDFVEVLGYENKGERNMTRILVPPGMSRDCIVEYRWSVRAQGGLPQDTNQERYIVQEPWFVLKKVFYIDPTAYKLGRGFWLSRFVWTQIGAPSEFNYEKDKNTLVVSYANVPALEYFPYGNRHLDNNTSFVNSFKTASTFGENPDEFWSNVARDFYGLYFWDKTRKSSKYKTFVADLKKNKPQDEREALVYVFNRFRQEMSYIGLLPPEKKSAAYKILSKEEDDPTTGQIFNRGFGSRYELCKVFYDILDDLKMEPKMLLTSSIYGPRFHKNELSLFSLDILNPLFGYQDQNGAWYLVSPGHPNYPAGYAPYYYTGGTALVVDPWNQKKTSWSKIQRYPSEAHKRQRQYKVAVDADGTFNFEIIINATGAWEAVNKAYYLEYPADEHGDMLKQLWQARSDSWEVTDAEVLNTADFEKTIVEKISAVKSYDTSEDDVLAVHPFPGGLLPLSIPSAWPTNRTQPVILPHAGIQTDYAEFTLPEGWQLLGDPSWKKENRVGAVSMTAQQEGNILKVRRDIIIKADLMMPEFEKELKLFFAWMEESAMQNIGIRIGGES